MIRRGSIELEWGGGSHVFRLGLGEIEELERATDMSVFLLLAAVSDRVPLARAAHYSEVIRIGLIGGGMNPVEARALVRRYVDERPLYESVALARAVLMAAIERVHSPSEDGASGEAETSKSDGSTSASSTETPS